MTRTTTKKGVLAALFAPLAFVGLLHGCGTDRPGAGSGGGAADPEAPCPDGAERTCYGILGISNGIKSCFTGTQRCVASRWSACEAPAGKQIEITNTPTHFSGAGLGLAPESEGSGGLRTQNHVPPSPDAGCDNPCDPSCEGWFDCAGGLGDGGVAPSGPMIPVIPAAAYCGIANRGSRWSDRQVCGPSGSNNNSCSGGCSDQCRHDMFCDTSLGTPNCRFFPAGGTLSGGCSWDLTVSVGCFDAVSSQWALRVCNRGQAAVPATATAVPLGYKTGTSSAAVTSCPYPPAGFGAAEGQCNLNLAGLAPGQCRDVALTTDCGIDMTGLTRTFVINHELWPGTLASENNRCNNSTIIVDSYKSDPNVACQGTFGGGGDGGGGGGADGGVCPPGLQLDRATTPPPAWVPFPGMPGGHVDKMLSQSAGCPLAGSFYGHHCSHWPHAAGTGAPNLGFSACQGDTYCDMATGGSCCKKFDPGQTHAAGHCTTVAPDLTIGNACKIGAAGNAPRSFPVCNRGTAPVPAGTVITIGMKAPSGELPQATAYDPSHVPATLGVPTQI